MDSNLEKIAQRAKDKLEDTLSDGDELLEVEDDSLTEYEQQMDESDIGESEPFDDNDDDPVIGFGSDVPKVSDIEPEHNLTAKETKTPDISDDELFTEPLEDDDVEHTDVIGISLQQITDMLGNIPEKIRTAVAKELIEEVGNYKKDLMISQGFTIAEADSAGKKFLEKRIKEKTTELSKGSDAEAVIIELKKGEEGKLEIPDDAKEKVVKSKVIQLKVVEDVDLANIQIEKVKPTQKMKLINSIDSFLSQYSVPLPLVRDYVQFKGSQIMQLIQAVQYNDATPAEIIQKKASLIYSQLTSGTVLRKFDENGKTIMSFNDFTKKFYFHDMDMALYAILVASSMEEVDSRLTCGDCNGVFETKYSIKNLLNLDDISDEFKDIFEDILSHKNDPEFMMTLHENGQVAWRVESPLTRNIYDLQYPSIADAINVQRYIDPDDSVSIYHGSLLIFFQRMYVYDKSTGKYIELSIDKNLKEIFEIMSRVPQEELDVLLRYLSPKVYQPKFILKTQCDNCGYRMENKLLIEDMVFLKARDSQMEIR